jgi:tetratricopeptide (TPR) repeat protein
MSQRRSILLVRYCSRPSGLRLTNAEVNGFPTKSSESRPARATCERKFSSHVTTKSRGKKKQRKKGRGAARHTFKLRFNEAKTLEHRRAYGRAEALYNQLIHFCKHKIGINRSEAAIPYNQLALMHFQRGRLELAKPLFEKSLQILITSRGTGHRHTQTVRANLAYLLREQARRHSS